MGGTGRGRRAFITPLRQARLSLPATQEQVCEALAGLAGDHDLTVTPSMLSGWELGRRTTSVRYRALLATYYRRPAEELFAHQDGMDASTLCAPVLLRRPGELLEAMNDVVDLAETHLAVMGSRARDASYLTGIEDALATRPGLVHYRILTGPPRHRLLLDHLRRLLDLRDPSDRSLGVKTLHIGLLDTGDDIPERFFCASEERAVVPIPSMTAMNAFDTGVGLTGEAATRLIDHARQCYAASRRLESRHLLDRLEATLFPDIRSPG
jgi:transcriptional regulator with XRE-family HTH domain